MRKYICLCKWLSIAVLLIIGLWLLFFVVGHGFLGLILCGIAGIILCYYLLSKLQKRRQKAARVLNRTLTGTLIFGCLLSVLTLIPIVRAADGYGSTQSSYIVVLGAKVNGTVPSLVLRNRIDAAYDYLTTNPETIAVLSGGQGADEGISEAQCMYNELVKMGISPQRLWLEEQATSTRENLIFSLDLIEGKTGSRPGELGVLSSEFHLYRAKQVADQCGIVSAGIPAQTSWLTLKLNYYLREIPATWYYMLLGG